MSSNIFCAGCLRDDENNAAEAWCSNCSEYVCGPCAKVHKKFSPPHGVVPIDQAPNLKKSIFTIGQNCETHKDEKIVMFCCQHDKIICASCVSEAHQNCKPIMSIEKAAKDVRGGTAMADLERRLNHLIKATEKIIDDYTTNLSALDEQKQEIVEEKITIQKKIDIHLIKMERNFEEQLNKEYDNAKRRVVNRQRELQTTFHELSSLRDDIRSLKDNASDIHLFKAVKVIDSKTSKQESVTYGEMKKYVKVGLGFNPIKETVRIPDLLSSFGTVVSHETLVDIITEQSKIQEGQVKVQAATDKVTLLHSFKTSSLGQNVNVNDACFVNDSNILLLSYKPVNAIYRCKVDGSQSHVAKLPFTPHRLAAVDDQTVFITSQDDNGGLGVFSPNTMQLMKQINKGTKYSLVCSFNDTIVFRSDYNEISMMTINEKVLKKIKLKHNPWSVCFNKGGDIFYVDRSPSKEIHCIPRDMGNKYVFYTDNDIREIDSIAIDKEDNIYITDTKTYCVHKISKDGTTKNILLTKEDRIDSPGQLTINQKTNLLLLTHGGGRTVNIYSL